jgi:uncharacterized protein YndB with AHSA1/START domain
VQPKPAILDTIGGRPVLRFERLLRHSPGKVWKAITDPAELAHWFPARVATELRVGAPMRFTFESDPAEGGPVTETPGGEIIEFDPPKVFAYRWGQDVLRWELVPEDSGCRLHFSHVLSDAQGGAAAAGRNAAGWDVCLDALSTRLDDRPPPEPAANPAQMLGQIEAYVERFGLGRGEVLDQPGGCVLRFERDLVWTPPDRAWAILTDPDAITAAIAADATADRITADGIAAGVGERPPSPATNDVVPAGPITSAEPPHLLEYEWLHDGRPAGRVRWEITSDPLAGTRLVLTQTVPSRLSGLRERALTAWQSHLERLFAAMFGQARS